MVSHGLLQRLVLSISHLHLCDLDATWIIRTPDPPQTSTPSSSPSMDRRPRLPAPPTDRSRASPCRLGKFRGPGRSKRRGTRDETRERSSKAPSPGRSPPGSSCTPRTRPSPGLSRRPMTLPFSPRTRDRTTRDTDSSPARIRRR